VAAVLAGLLAGAVLVFSLGVMVGRRAAESVSGAGALVPEPVAETIAPPSTVPVPPERMTFYDRLSGRPVPAAEELPTGPPPPAPAAEPPGGATVAPPSPAAPAPAPPRAAPAAPASADPVARLKGLLGRGPWVVQLAAVSQRDAAEELAARYRRMGFDVESSPVTSRGRSLHRVRVGSFPDRAAATRAAEIFRSDLGLPGSMPVKR